MSSKDYDPREFAELTREMEAWPDWKVSAAIDIAQALIRQRWMEKNERFHEAVAKAERIGALNDGR